MKNKLSDINKCCKYCEKACDMVDADVMLCSFHGVVICDHFCRKFKYDPLKRDPGKLPPLPKLNSEDLLL